MAKIKLETVHFEFNHGHKPRGFGLWMIEIDGADVIEFKGTITELKKNLYQICKERGFKAPQKVRLLP